MGQFAYFDRQLGHPDWTGKRVLDFGGNVGNILLDPACRIEPCRYWSIDVSRDAITEGKRRHPEGHFVFYDRYNFEYNPTGVPGLPVPDVGVRFDVIVGWSVFTHTSRAEMLELAERLMELLSDDGVAAFTFFDPWWTPPPGSARDSESPGLSNIHWRLEARREINKGMNVAGLLQRARDTELNWAVLVNDDLSFDPDEDGTSVEKAENTYITFCTPDYLRRLFPGARVRDPVPPERQSCMILQPMKGQPA
jgi:SAM-dependent methyltransferase